jgi:hypothetical protein
VGGGVPRRFRGSDTSSEYLALSPASLALALHLQMRTKAKSLAPLGDGHPAVSAWAEDQLGTWPGTGCGYVATMGRSRVFPSSRLPGLAGFTGSLPTWHQSEPT